MADIHTALNGEIRRAHVRGVLEFHVHKKQFVDYRTLAAVFGMFSGGSELARILGEIQTEDDAAGRGLLSSLVVGVSTGLPGKGYFEHARQKLKRPIATNPAAERAFWVAELAKLGMSPPTGGSSNDSTSEIDRALHERLPNCESLFTPDDRLRLADAWERGAASYSTPHPAIDILLGEQIPAELIMVLDEGLARMLSQGTDLRPIIERFINERDFRLARGAANELWALSHLAAAGGVVQLEDPKAAGKKPEATVMFDDEVVTLEVVGLNGDHRRERENNNLAHMFNKWPRGKRPSPPLHGHVRDGGQVRILEMHVPVICDGDHVAKVDALSAIKDASQLRGRPNPILVISARHQWGFFAADCQPTRTMRGRIYTGIGYAAMYGRAGDYLFAGEEFDGRGYDVGVQKQDGLLRRSRTLAAVVFLFQDGNAVVFENLQEGCGFTSGHIARLVANAFRIDAQISVLRANRGASDEG